MKFLIFAFVTLNLTSAFAIDTYILESKLVYKKSEGATCDKVIADYNKLFSDEKFNELENSKAFQWIDFSEIYGCEDDEFTLKSYTRVLVKDIAAEEYLYDFFQKVNSTPIGDSNHFLVAHPIDTVLSHQCLKISGKKDDGNFITYSNCSNIKYKNYKDVFHFNFDDVRSSVEQYLKDINADAEEITRARSVIPFVSRMQHTGQDIFTTNYGYKDSSFPGGDTRIVKCSNNICSH